MSMKPENKIEKLISRIEVEPDSAKTRHTLKAMLKAQASNAGPSAPPASMWRILMKAKMPQLTAAAIVIVAALVFLTQSTFVQPTFAEIVRPLMDAETIIYDFITGPEDGEGPVIHDIVKGTRIRRTISNLPGITIICDTQNAKMLHLVEKDKKATYMDMTGDLQLGTQEFLKFIRWTILQAQEHKEPAAGPESLGTRQIDGRKVVGYAAGGDQRIEIWADVKTSLPVKIILGIGPNITTLKNFQFDVPVDDALVSMDVPEGYTVQESNLNLSDATEEDFIAGLKVWATVLRDGTFPDSVTVDQCMLQVPKLEPAIGRLNLSAQEAERMGASFIKGMMFISLYTAKDLEPWHYAGAGVKFGASEKPIFWYRAKGATDYRVIYGDLHVENVPPENLPQ